MQQIIARQLRSDLLSWWRCRWMLAFMETVASTWVIFESEETHSWNYLCHFPRTSLWCPSCVQVLRQLRTSAFLVCFIINWMFLKFFWREEGGSWLSSCIIHPICFLYMTTISTWRLPMRSKVPCRCDPGSFSEKLRTQLSKDLFFFFFQASSLSLIYLLVTLIYQKWLFWCAEYVAHFVRCLEPVISCGGLGLCSETMLFWEVNLLFSF